MRYSNHDGVFCADAVSLVSESRVDEIFHPFVSTKRTSVKEYRCEPLFAEVMKDGKAMTDGFSPDNCARYAKERLAKLPEEHKRFEFPHTYKVGISKEIQDLRSGRIDDLQERYTRRQEDSA
jgi:nicotinate phosphoribosyltransferase